MTMEEVFQPGCAVAIHPPHSPELPPSCGRLVRDFKFFSVKRNVLSQEACRKPLEELSAPQRGHTAVEQSGDDPVPSLFF